MVEVFRGVRRVLRKDGTVWLNLGDSYASSGTSDANGNARLHEWNGDAAASRNGSRRRRLGGNQDVVKGRAPTSPGLKPKDRMMVPARVALALQADGWWLRDEIVWHKPNPMPSSVTDRTTPAHEMVYLLTKSARYFYDNEGIKAPASMGAHLKRGEDADFRNSSQAAKQGGWNDLPPTENPAGRNKRSVWTIPTAPYGNFKIEAAPGQRDDDDGSGRTTSPDCPVHGDRRHREPTAERGERLDASDPGRTPHNGRHHEQVPLFGLAPIAQLPVSDSEPDSSGSLLPECGEPATPRSTQNHRTDLAPATSPHGIDAEGSSDRTGRTSPDVEIAASGDRNPESRTGAGFAGDGTRRSSPAETPDRSACTCTSWVSVSHFAVFPPKLVEPCILAGSKPGDVVLDPFGGSGTVGMVAQMHSRLAVLIDLNPDYLAQCLRRGAQSPLGLETA
jgi:DNA modification methylase